MLDFLFFLLFLVMLIIEIPIVMLFARKHWKEAIPIVILINLFTWPLANGLIVLGVNFFLVEFIVLLLEWFFIKELLEISWLKAFGASAIANIITAIIGMGFLYI